jgi:hypothetical protein
MWWGNLGVTARAIPAMKEIMFVQSLGQEISMVFPDSRFRIPGQFP